jgi:hypothetical protein
MQQGRLKSEEGQAAFWDASAIPDNSLAGASRLQNHTACSEGAFMAIAKQTAATVIPALQYRDRPLLFPRGPSP